MSGLLRRAIWLLSCGLGGFRKISPPRHEGTKKTQSILLCALVSLWFFSLSTYAGSSGLPPPTSQSDQTTAIPKLEREALIALYSRTNGDGRKAKTNWLGPPGRESTWCGVTVEKGHVTALKIINNNLVGPIPAAIGNITNELYSAHLANEQLAFGIEALSRLLPSNCLEMQL